MLHWVCFSTMRVFSSTYRLLINRIGYKLSKQTKRFCSGSKEFLTHIPFKKKRFFLVHISWKRSMTCENCSLKSLADPWPIVDRFVAMKKRCFKIKRERRGCSSGVQGHLDGNIKVLKWVLFVCQTFKNCY